MKFIYFWGCQFRGLDRTTSIDFIYYHLFLRFTTIVKVKYQDFRLQVLNFKGRL